MSGRLAVDTRLAGRRSNSRERTGGRVEQLRFEIDRFAADFLTQDIRREIDRSIPQNSGLAQWKWSTNLSNVVVQVLRRPIGACDPVAQERGFCILPAGCKMARLSSVRTTRSGE
jgi:hypothetical protein